MAALLVLCAAPQLGPVRAQSKPPEEYDLKAVFLSQFITFVDGFRFQQDPNADGETAQRPDDPITVGIIGEDPFHDAISLLTERRVHQRKVVVTYFQGLSELTRQDKDETVHPDIEKIKKCDVVFLCPSERAHIQDILRSIREERILTVADVPRFLEQGGIINMMMENYKIRFEINMVTATQARLTIRSKLLRLAKRVIEEEDADASKK